MDDNERTEAAETDEDIVAALASSESATASTLQSSDPYFSSSGSGAELRRSCLAALEARWSQLFPGAPPSPAAPDFSEVVLPDLARVAPAAVDVLGGDVHHAFAASLVAYAGFDVSPRWLRNQFGTGAGYTAVACIKGGGGVSTTLLRHGRSLYVATAGVLSWRGWVDFFAAPTVPVSTKNFPSRPLHACATLPADVAVNRDAWYAFHAQRLVPAAICAALDRSLREATPVAAIVFCGHGLGAAVAQLMAAAWEPAGINAEVKSSTLITFGCPGVGDTAFQALVSSKTWHQRLFVAQDPIAGLPHSPCVGLSLSPSVGVYAVL